MKLLIALLSMSPVCFPTPALVQAKTVNSTISVTSQAASFTSAPSVGDVAVVGISFGNILTNAAVTDNQGNAYVQLGAQSNSALSIQASLWCAQVGTSSGTFTVTATSSTGTAVFITVYILEYSGVSCQADKTTSAFGLTSPYACGSFTTRQPVALLLSTIDTASGGAALTFTPPSGFTIQGQTTNGTLFQAGAIADNIVSSTGSFTFSWSVSSSASASCVTAAIYPASGGGGTAFSFGVP